MQREPTRQQIAAETRSKIYFSAQELFAENLFENVSIRDICKRADVSIGTFYYYFPNKESILNEGYRQFDVELEARWKGFCPKDEFDAIYFLMRSQLATITERGVIGAVQFFKHQLTIKEKYILNKGRFFYQMLILNVSKAIEKGKLTGDAETLTDDILRATRGIIYDWCLHDGEFDIFIEGERFLSIILDSALVRN